MSKFFVLLLGVSLFCAFSSAQVLYTVNGSVIDENRKPLTGASVFLFPTKKGTVTNSNGDFCFHSLSKGRYIIEISFIGYKTVVDTVLLVGNKKCNFQLKVSSLTLQDVVVIDNHVESRKKEESLNIEIVNKDYLKQNLGGSLMSSLERLPGVTSIDIGSGQSKPVIRGLGFNRVVVVENNIKHEAQQWGADHGLEIDQYAVDNIEVVKGPASLMYGSDAIGGLIDMKNKKIPVENSFGGTIDLTGKSNNDALGTSVSLFGRKKWLFADLRATFLGYGDYKVPTDSVDIYSYRAPLHKNHLRNTAGKEQNLHFSFGMIHPKYQSRFYLSNVNSKSGFFANAHGLEPININSDLYDKSSRDIQYPYHSTNHFKVINSTVYRFEKLKLEFDLGLQQNLRQEWSRYVQHEFMPPTFPDTISFDGDLERQFEKKVYSTNVKSFYQLSDNTQINCGINSEYQDNQISGRGFIIPAYIQSTFGGFLFAKHRICDNSHIQAGIRYDCGNLKTVDYFDWYEPFKQRAWKIDRNFSNYSWSVGYNYNPEKWSYKANVGKSFRMPTPQELAANGVNNHYFRYEIGNADLSPEISYQLDAGIEFSSTKFAIGTTPFINYFSNYIYSNPSSKLLGALQKYYYTQSEVFRYGAEMHAHYEVSKNLQLGIIGEYVYSEQLSGEKRGFTLPFSPPPSGILNLKYKKQRVGFVEKAYLSVDYRVTVAQNNIVPPEKSTDGYQVINLGLGGDVVYKNQRINISMQVQNLFDAKYFNHTSYYRLINIPEAGRNLIVNISIPFSGIIKQEMN